MKCNWRVFYENSIDGYHLSHLHQKTLGGPAPGWNTWEPHGRHFLWYATADGARRSSLPKAIEDYAAGHNLAVIEGAEGNDCAGVYMMFPSTIVEVNPYSTSVTRVIPTGLETTRLMV
jgi:choline monooxygenase